MQNVLNYVLGHAAYSLVRGKWAQCTTVVAEGLAPSQSFHLYKGYGEVGNRLVLVVFALVFPRHGSECRGGRSTTRVAQTCWRTATD